MIQSSIYMPFTNKAAWQPSANSHQLEVHDGPTPAPSADEIVIKVAYVAINPSEWKFQDYAYVSVPYPHVLGSDAAGTVVMVGAKVKNVKVGDRVIGYVMVCFSYLSNLCLT
jgi:NADPH:quinone reductase-like Zn-dependent oxidoreductase